MKKKTKKFKHSIRKLVIGYQTIDVDFLCRMDRQHDGFYSEKTHKIGVIEHLPIEEANTVLHESLHALWKTQGVREWVDDSKVEEPIVNALANGLTQIFRDNPKLLLWLKERIDD